MSTQPLPELAHRGWLWSLRIFTALSVLVFLIVIGFLVGEGSTALAMVLCSPWVLCGLVVPMVDPKQPT